MRCGCSPASGSARCRSAPGSAAVGVARTANRPTDAGRPPLRHHAVTPRTGSRVATGASRGFPVLRHGVHRHTRAGHPSGARRTEEPPMIATSTRPDITDAAEACIARFAAPSRRRQRRPASALGRVLRRPVPAPRRGAPRARRAGQPARRCCERRRAHDPRRLPARPSTTDGSADAPVQHVDPDELWAAFVPTSYRIPRRVAATTWEVCRRRRSGSSSSASSGSRATPSGSPTATSRRSAARSAA